MTDRDAAESWPGVAIAWLFGLAPVALFLLTWTEKFSPLQQSARAYALPVLAAEMAIVAMSFREGLRLRKAPLTVLAAAAALAVHVWATAFTAPWPTHAVARTGVWTIHVLFALAIVNLWHHRMLDFEQQLRALQTGFLLFFALLLIFVATTQQTPDERIWRLPAFGNIRWVGYYAAATVGLAASGFLHGRRFALFSATAAFAAIFWTGTRGGIAAALVGMLASALLFRAFRKQRVWSHFFLCGLAGLALSFALSALLPIEGQGPNAMSRLNGSGRIELWLTTIEDIARHPFVGWGEAQMAHLSGRQWHVAQPHNIVLQVLHAWGAVGGSLCLALAIWMAPKFLKAHDARSAPFQCAALILAAYSFIDGALYYGQSVALFALCVAAAIAVGFEESAGRESTSAD